MSTLNRWTGSAWEEVMAAPVAHDHDADYEADGAVATHSADTTSVHGIADTSALATATSVATAVSDHSADTTSVHGIADTTVLATDAEVAAAIAAAALVVANRQTASYGLVLADAGKVVEMNVASANNLTVPLNSTQAFAVGTCIELLQYGAGQTTIVATGGVTIRSSGGKLKLGAQYAQASLRKIATDEWVAAGELSA